MPTVSILTYSSNDKVYNQNIIFTKIVITNLKKNTKIMISVLQRNKDYKKCFKKA